jgi:hypothetical protein
MLSALTKKKTVFLSSLLLSQTKQKQLFNCLNCFLLNDITASCKNVVRFEKIRLPLISSLLFPHTKQKQLFNCLKCFLLNDIFEKSVLFEVRFFKESKFEVDNIFAICCNRVFTMLSFANLKQSQIVSIQMLYSFSNMQKTFKKDIIFNRVLLNNRK